MAKEIYGSLKKQENLFSGIRRALSNDTLSALTGNESYTEFQSALAALAGNEGFGLSNTLGKLNPASYGAFSASVARNASGFSDISRSNEFSDAATSLSRLAGYEGFSMQNWKGSELDMKAANMTLNAQSHLQTEAADLRRDPLCPRRLGAGAHRRTFADAQGRTRRRHAVHLP